MPSLSLTTSVGKRPPSVPRLPSPLGPSCIPAKRKSANSSAASPPSSVARSDVTTPSCPNSPSDFCEDNVASEEWRAHLDVIEEDCSPPEDLFRLAAPLKFSLHVSDLTQILPEEHFYFSKNVRGPTYIQSLREACVDNGMDDTEGAISLWPIIAEAFRQHEVGWRISEVEMRRGVDTLLDLVFSNLPNFGVGRELEYWLPVSHLGPSRVPKVDAAAYCSLKCLNRSLFRDRSEDLLFFNQAVGSSSATVDVMPLSAVYKTFPTAQARNQLRMDLIGAAYFARYVGLIGLTFYGILITGLEYSISSVCVVEAGSMTIQQYESRPLITFADFVRLYFALADLRNRLVAQLQGKVIDGADVAKKASWRSGKDRSPGGPDLKPGGSNRDDDDSDGGGDGGGGDGRVEGDQGSSPPLKRLRTSTSNSGSDGPATSRDNAQTHAHLHGVAGKPRLHTPTPIRVASPAFLESSFFAVNSFGVEEAEDT